MSENDIDPRCIQNDIVCIHAQYLDQEKWICRMCIRINPERICDYFKKFRISGPLIMSKNMYFAE